MCRVVASAGGFVTWRFSFLQLASHRALDAHPRAERLNRNASPLAVLRGAINTVLDAPNFTLITTELSPSIPLPGGARRSVMTAVIQKPDRVALSGGQDAAIAIGSIGYLPGPPGEWTVERHVGESANFTNAALLYLHVLDRTTSVNRRDDSYMVPSAEIVSLLDSTRLSYFHNATDTTWTATVRAGSLQSMTLHYDQQAQSVTGSCGTISCILAASPVTVTVTVSRVGMSPPINPPAKDSIVS